MKIFCVGLSKTATTSLAAALEVLGYRSAHWNFTRTVLSYEEDGSVSIDYSKFEDHDAFADTPIARVYPELDVAFPDSKFILTVRDPEDWAASFRSHFEQYEFPAFTAKLHTDLYGVVGYDHEKCLGAFHDHTARVKRYFEERPEDLLVLDIPSGDGWDKLAGFLGRPMPDVPFPKRFTRSARIRQRLVTRILVRLKRSLATFGGQQG